MGSENANYWKIAAIVFGAAFSLLASGLIVLFVMGYEPTDAIANFAKYGAFGDFFGGTLNPIIGLVTAYFAYQAYQNTKVSAQQQKFVATVELFMKIYDVKFTGIRYEINPGHELVGEAACERIARDLKGVLGIATSNIFGNYTENVPKLDDIISIVKPLVDAIAVLEKQLTDTHERTKFFEIVVAYSSANLLRCVQCLGNCQNYEPADRASFILLQQVAQRLTRP